MKFAAYMVSNKTEFNSCLKMLYEKGYSWYANTSYNDLVESELTETFIIYTTPDTNLAYSDLEFYKKEYKKIKGYKLIEYKNLLREKKLKRICNE